MPITNPPTALSYLALGDSYTIGEGAAEPERWPAQLVDLLRAEGLDLAEPTYVAQTGWTTAELLEALAARAAALRPPYDLVSLLIGVNNQYRGQPLAHYEAEFGELLARAVAYAGGRLGRVLVLSIPDWGPTPFAEGRDRALIAAEIDAYNAAACAQCAAANVAFVDITPQTRAAAGDPAQLTADGLHYSEQHMRGWAAAAALVARGLLGVDSARR